jgi:membrane associated rhomboid family serine protease
VLFFPYKADISLFHIPFITILITLLCLGIYQAQHRNLRAVQKATGDFCSSHTDRQFKIALKKSLGSSDEEACEELMVQLQRADDAEAHITELAAKASPMASLSHEASQRYLRRNLADAYHAYQLQAPEYLTAKLWYDPQSWNPLAMVTAAVAHGSWSHVIGNLFFFFAFAATLEIVLGPLAFLAVLLALALGTHTFYSIYSLAQADPLPSVGLSGVVMGAMALFVFFLPKVRIRCILWLLVFLWRPAVPAWLLVGWYAGVDIYHLFSGEASGGINLVAHVTGAALGYGIGLVFFRAKRAEIRADTQVGA